ELRREGTTRSTRGTRDTRNDFFLVPLVLLWFLPFFRWVTTRPGIAQARLGPIGFGCARQLYRIAAGAWPSPSFLKCSGDRRSVCWTILPGCRSERGVRAR